MEIIGWAVLVILAGLMGVYGLVTVYGVGKYIVGWIRGKYR